MIIPEDLLEEMKYYTIKRFEPKYDVDFCDRTCYDLVTIVTKKWWKKDLEFQFPCVRRQFKDYISSQECIELVNQIKTFIAADNGYKVAEPTITLGIKK